MLYHVIRRPLQTNTTHSSNQSKSTQRSGSLSPTTFMPRYHYSRIVSSSPTNNLESISPRYSSDGQTTKSSMTATTTTTNNNNNNNQNSPYGSFKSTIIPLVTNNRMTTATSLSNKREFIQIPVNREDGTSLTTNNQTRSVPITYVTETNTNKNGHMNPKSTFTRLTRPSSKYFQYHMGNSVDEQLTPSNLSRLPSVSRRLSLTVPVTTTTTTTTQNFDDDTLKQSNPSSPSRPVSLRFPSSTPTTPPVVTNSRVSSSIQQSSQLSNALQRQKADIGDGSLSSPTLSTINNSSQISSDSTVSSPTRRAEILAREAIQIMSRNQQAKSSTNSENNHSPPLARRVIINLKNNQSVSLDSRLSSLNKPPLPSSFSTARSIQRNNLYHIPILHEIQMLSHPSMINSDNSSQSTSVNNNNGNYKNEFHMEIPVTMTNNTDQENNGINHHPERISSAINNHSHQTLKSILKRSSSRETVLRKNVSFMNA